MSKLIEKMSYGQRGLELDRLLESKVKAIGIRDSIKAHEDLMTYIAEQVELAYIAGYNRFNAVTHDCIEVTSDDEIVDTNWVNLKEEFPLTGPDSQLPSIYSQSKGFKP